MVLEDRAFRAKLGFVDPNFLDIFSFPVIRGDPSRVLQDKYSVLITEKIAQKYFNNANPVGELLPIQRGEEIQNFTITGIVQNAPKNSTIQFDVLLPFEQGGFEDKWNIYYSGFNVYDAPPEYIPKQSRTAIFQMDQNLVGRRQRDTTQTPATHQNAL